MDTALFTTLINLGWGGAVLALLIMRVMVLGWEHRRMEKERDFWKSKAEANELTAQKAVDGLAAANQVIGALQTVLQRPAATERDTPWQLPPP